MGRKVSTVRAAANIGTAGDEFRAGDHFGYDEAGSQRISQAAERQI
jgi:hypothetical protein